MRALQTSRQTPRHRGSDAPDTADTANRSRGRGREVVQETHLNPGTATWRAPCVHGRIEVTWFRTQVTAADHEECPCPPG